MSVKMKACLFLLLFLVLCFSGNATASPAGELMSQNDAITPQTNKTTTTETDTTTTTQSDTTTTPQTDTTTTPQTNTTTPQTDTTTTPQTEKPTIPPSITLTLTMQDENFMGKFEIKDQRIAKNFSSVMEYNQKIMNIISCEYKFKQNSESKTESCLKDGKILFTEQPEPKEFSVSYKGKYDPKGLLNVTMKSKPVYFADLENGEVKNFMPVLTNYDSAKKEIKVSQMKILYKYGLVEPNTPVEIDYKSVIIIGNIEQIESKGRVPTYSIKYLDPNQIVTKISNEIYDILEENRDPLAKIHRFLTPYTFRRDINTKGLLTMSETFYSIPKRFVSAGTQSLITRMSYNLARQWLKYVKDADRWLNVGLSATVNMALNSIKEAYGVDISIVNIYQLLESVQRQAFEIDAYSSAKSLQSYNNEEVPYDGLEHPVLHFKSALILRELWASPENVIKYVRERKYNIQSLCESFNLEPNQKESLTSWNENTGYPVVHIQLGKENATSTLSQEQFLWNGKGHNSSWCLPVYQGVNGVQWLKDNSNLTLNREPVLGILGHFRVNYDTNSWEYFTQKLINNYKTYNEAVRAQLVDDVFSFARSTGVFKQKLPDYKMAFSLLEYSQNETSYLPIKAILNAFDFLETSIENSHFEAYMKTTVGNFYKKFPITYPANTIIDKLKVMEVASWAGRLNLAGFIKDVDNLTNTISHFDDNPDLYETCFCSKVKRDVGYTYPFITYIAQETNITIKSAFVRIIGCANDKKLMKDWLVTMLLSGAQNKDLIFEYTSSLLKNQPKNIGILLDALNSNQTKIQRCLDGPEIERLLLLTTRSLNGENIAKAIEIAKTYNLGALKKHMEIVSTAATTWKKEKVDIIKNYFNGASQGKPFALIMLLSATLTFVNSFFK